MGQWHTELPPVVCGISHTPCDDSVQFLPKFVEPASK
jgi:hypothetical protein